MVKKRVFLPENIEERKEGVPEIVSVGIYEVNNWAMPYPDSDHLTGRGIYYRIYLFTNERCHNSSLDALPKSPPFCTLATKYHSTSELQQACSLDIHEATDVEMLCNRCVGVKEMGKLVEQEIELDEGMFPVEKDIFLDWNEVMILRIPYNRLTHTQVVYEKPEYRGTVMRFQRKVVKKLLDDIMKVDPMLPQYINTIKRFLDEEK